MALDASKWEIQNDKDIRYIGPAHTLTGANYVTTIELHRWLGGLADDASMAGDDFLDITKDTPSDRSTDNIITLINGYNLDDASAEFVYGGSIIQDGGNTIYDGMLVYANPDMHMEIIQNGANVANDFWNSVMFNDGGINPNGYKGLNFDTANGISHRFMLKVRSAGADIDGRRLICHTREWGKTYSEFKINGTSRGQNVAALTYSTDLNNATLIGSMTGSPFNTVSLTTAGYSLIDVNNNTVDEPYYSEWNRGSASINQFYETMKYKSRRGETATLYGLEGQIFRGVTHEVAVTTPRTNTIAEGAAATWTGGTGQVLARDSAGTATKLWIQLLTGVAPTAGQTITVGSGTVTAGAGTPSTERPLSFPFCGVSTGSAIIGAYGFGIEKLDLSANDKVFDLDNNPWQSPNYVNFTVSNLVSGDRVLVAPLGYRFEYDGELNGPFAVGDTLTFTNPAGTAKLVKLIDRGLTGEMVISDMITGTKPTNDSTIANGGTATAAVNGPVSNDINFGQMTLNGALTTAGITSVVVNGSIPSDTPATGTIRILRVSGFYTLHAYTGWSGSTFTIGSTDFSGDNAANSTNVFISYFDDTADAANEGFTSIYNADRKLFVRVRNGSGAPKIKTYETDATLGSAGGSATTSRIADE